MKISIYTPTIGGRPLYIKKLFNFIHLNRDQDIDWHIGVQGKNIVLDIPNKDYIHLHVWDENCGAGEANNKLLKHIDAEIVCKLDDDALPYGSDYFLHIREIFKLTNGNAIFSPYPVGLINNPGGVLSKEHSVVYSSNSDTYYTLRKVNHIGGFARISPAHIAKSFTWPYDFSAHNSGREDVNFSSYCNSNNIPMYYLENSLIVEHQESTLGQHKRYNDTYFKGRF